MTNQILSWSALLTVLSASLMGSGHCVAMCGGFSVVVGSDKFRLTAYHCGRLVGYAMLGVLAGCLGSLIRIESPQRSTFLEALSLLSSLMIAGLLIGMGIRVFQNRPLEMKWPEALKKIFEQRWAQALRSRSKVSGALLIGLFSALLPCGWLYTFVLAAAATQSPLWGSLTLFIFWLGTLPALTLAPAVIRGFFIPLRSRFSRVSGLLLILAGLLSLSVRSASEILWRHHCLPTSHNHGQHE